MPPARGSHPATDPLWGHGALELIHDGFDRTRLQKLADLKDEQVVRKLLRVCWQRNHPYTNCCVCGKCLRNMAILRSLGLLQAFATFHRPLDLKALARQPVTLPHWREMLLEVQARLGTPSRDPALSAAITASLSGHGKEPPGMATRLLHRWRRLRAGSRRKDEL